jgi:hypothetical protein
VIEFEGLRQREVEAGGDRLRAQVARQGGLDGNAIARHRGLVVGAGRSVCNADREDREVIEEEGIEVIIGVDDQHVGFRGMEMLCDLGIEPRGWAIRALLGHQRGKIRRVGDADGGNDLGHLAALLPRQPAYSGPKTGADTSSQGLPAKRPWTLC